MFDLFRSRQKTMRYVMGILLGLVALSMVITLVPSYGTSYSGKDPTLLAEIGDQRVTAMEVRQVLQREMRANSFPKGMEQVYVPMLVQQMVAERAVAYEAKRLGFRVSDQQLAETIRSLIPQLFEGGKFVGNDVYAQFLAQQGLTIQQFEDNVKQQVLGSRLETLVLEGVIVTPEQVEQEFRRKNEKLKIAFFGLTPDLARSKVTVTPVEVEEFFKAHRQNYNSPERRSYMIFPIEEAKIAETIQVPEADLQRAYNENQERFRTPERVQVQHILLMTKDKKPEELPQIQKRAEDLLKQVQGGANFSDLAKKNSEDRGTAPNGGEYGWMVRGQTVPEFEQAAFGLKPGQVSGLVKTIYGLHIIKVHAHEDAHLKPFAEVKDEIQKEVAKAKVYDKMQTLADQIRNAMVKSLEEAEKIAVANGVKPVKVEKVTTGDPIPEVGVNPQFTEAVTGLPKNGVTPVLQIGQNKLVVAQVLELFPPRPAELAEVQNSIREAVLSQKAGQLMQQKVKEAQDKLKTVNGDLAGLAKQLGAELKTSDLVTREGAITGLGSAVAVDQGYSLNIGEVFGPIVAPSGTFFAKVVEKVPADLTQLAAMRAQMVQAIKYRQARERRELFNEGLVQRLIKEKKVKVYEDNVKKLVGSFRS
jgi:peptidyl-prolyl cis-trans isomerase D